MSFSNNADTVFELLYMDDAGKTEATNKLAALTPGGRTNVNLWDGLQSGPETLRCGAQSGSVPVVLLLTDGNPNIVPPCGHIPMLKRYQDEHSMTCPINTFGFGYQHETPSVTELTG